MKFARVASMTTVALLLASAVPSMADVANPIALQSGHSTVLEERGLHRVAVGDGEIAGVLPVGNHQLVINGKNPGRTTVFVWTDAGRETYEVTVTAQGTYQFADMLRASITYPNVHVVSYGHIAIVRGWVDTGEQLTNLQDIISRFSGTQAGNSGSKSEAKINIVNVVTVKHPLGNLQHDLAQIPGAKNLRVDADSKGNLIVSGQVEDRVAAERILGHVQGLSAPYLSVDGKVIDRLEVSSNTEIDVRVQVVEVDKNAQNQLGVSLQSAILDPLAGTYTYGPPQFSLIEGPKAANVGQGATVSSSFLRLSFLAPTLTALINHGDAKMLAEPHLTTLPGKKASFLVGGQIPYVVSTTLGQVSVVFKDYGVNLEVTPTILPNGSIQTEITPDISSLDYADAVTINGFSIPALKESRLSTVAISRPGQSIILGGMVEHVESKTISEFPILSKLPILGKLFRSTNYQENKSDVVFIMTPIISNH